MGIISSWFQFSDVVSIETLVECAQDIGGQKIGYINQYDKYEAELKNEIHDYSDKILERYKNSWRCHFLDIDIGSTVEISFRQSINSDFHADKPYVVQVSSHMSVDTSLYRLLCYSLVKMGGINGHNNSTSGKFEKGRYPINLQAEKQRIKENNRKATIACLLLPIYIPLVLIALPVKWVMDIIKKN